MAIKVVATSIAARITYELITTIRFIGVPTFMCPHWFLYFTLGCRVLFPLIEDLSITVFQAGVAMTVLNVAYAFGMYPGGKFSDQLTRVTLIIFGIGMSLSGGCGTSSLWRAAEAQIKLRVALIGFSLSGSYFREWLEESGWIMKIGEPVFLPDLIGWKMGLLAVVVLMVLWYLLSVWNEVYKKMVVV